MSRNIATAFLSIFASRVTKLLALALTTPLLIRFLGRSQYGQYATVMATFSLLMILTTSGLNSGARKFIAEERDREDWQSHVFGFYFRLAGAFSLIAASGFLLAAHFGLVAAVYGEAMVPYFYLLGVLAVFAQFGNYIRRSLMGLKLEHISEPINVTFTLTFTVAALVAAYVGWGVRGVLLMRILAFVVVIGLSTYFVARHLSVSQILKPTPSDFPRWELFSFNYKTVVYIFLLTSLYKVDIMMLGATVPDDQVAYYKAALVLAEFLWFAPRALQSVMIQSTSDLWARGKTDRITELSSRVTRYALLFTALLAIGIAALAHDFVPIYYGPNFVASVPPLLMLLPGALGFAVARPILSISHAKGDMRIMIVTTAASAGLNLVLNAVLIPAYGIVGAAFATSVGYGSLPVFHFVAARKLGFDPFADARLVRVALTGVVAAVPIWLLSQAIANPLLALLVVPPAGFVIYGVTALATGAVDLAEVFDVLSMLPQPVSSRTNALRCWLDTWV